MAEEKPFEPTASRLERAKREGDVARSQELGNVAAFAAGLAAASAVVAPLGAAAKAALVAAAGGRSDTAALAGALGLALVPPACAACASAACSALQSGGLRFIAVTVKFERLSPTENLRRMFSREAAVTVARATAAFACAAAAIVPAFTAIYASAISASGVGGLAQAAWRGALRTALAACVVGAVFAAIDFGVQYARWRNRLRMSFEELKRDRKEHDGDPLARGRRRALHRRIARGSLQRVKDAAFVVTNPTHIAIPLEYRPPEIAVPRVLLCAADEAAARVRELAASYGIPVVENVPLARLLYAGGEPGAYIPPDAYVAVAEIVAALGMAGGRAR